jgi:hypothetical protein
MRKQLYLAVVERLKTLTDDYAVKHFDVWNNNLMYVEENEAFNTPAVFVEFEPINWRQHLQGVREADVRFNLHIVTRRNMPTSNELNYAEESLAFFDLLEAINTCLHGLTQVSDSGVIDALTSVSSTTDNDYDELRHDIEAYSCHVTDLSALPRPETIATASIKVDINP